MPEGITTLEKDSELRERQVQGKIVVVLICGINIKVIPASDYIEMVLSGDKSSDFIKGVEVLYCTTQLVRQVLTWLPEETVAAVVNFQEVVISDLSTDSAGSVLLELDPLISTH